MSIPRRLFAFRRARALQVGIEITDAALIFIDIRGGIPAAARGAGPWPWA